MKGDAWQVTIDRLSGVRWRGPVAVVATVLAVVVAGAVATRLLSDSAEPAGWSSNGITLNTSSWEPGDDANEALIVSVVRVDPDGCVYLKRKGVKRGTDVVWPDGYTASRQPDGKVTISNSDGVVVAATGHRLRAGGGEAPPDAELACRAQGTVRGMTPFMIQDELPPLDR